jgi:hypothetical protein
MPLPLSVSFRNGNMSYAAASFDVCPNGKPPNGVEFSALSEPADVFGTVEAPDEPHE